MFSLRHTRVLPAVFVSLLLVAATFVVVPPSAHAAAYLTHRVDTQEDYPDLVPGDGVCAVNVEGDCSLRAAVMEANQATADDTVTILVPEGREYWLNWDDPNATGEKGDLDITGPADIRIVGAGADATRIIADTPYTDVYGSRRYERHFDVHDGAQLILGGVELVGGDEYEEGGSIRNTGRLKVERATFRGNTSGLYGGAIANLQGGTLTVVDSSFLYNEAGQVVAASGGAIFTVGQAAATEITGSTFVDNDTERAGATTAAHIAGLNNDSQIVVSDSTFTGSTSASSAIAGDDLTLERVTVSGAAGHGVVASDRLVMSDSTVADNGDSGIHLSGLSDGVYRSAQIRQSTISGNDAGGGVGGGIRSDGFDVNVYNSTIAGNTAFRGGGLALSNHSAVWLHSTTVAGNTAAAGTSIYATEFSTVYFENSILHTDGTDTAECVTDSTGMAVTFSFNIVSDASCGPGFGGDQMSTDPQLGPLADNGGPTLTMLPAPSSPAIDAGTFTGMGSDQRGVDRPQGDGYDIGAVEVVPNQPPTATIDQDSPVQVDEGGTVGLSSAGSSDPDGTIVTAEWDLDGDGTFAETGTDAERGDETGTTVVYDAHGDDGPAGGTVTLRVTDDRDGSDTTDVTVEVANVAPTVDAGTDQAAETGDTVTLDAVYADPGVADTHTATIDWGDGTVDGPTAVGGGTVTADHVYTTAGEYTATVTIADDDGGSGNDTVTVVVTDPPTRPAPSNDAPEPADDTATTLAGDPVDVDVLANDTDPDRFDTLSVSSVGTPDHGTVDVVDGQVVYTPEAGFVGDDLFTYTVTDGDDTVEAAVTVTVERRGLLQACRDEQTTGDVAGVHGDDVECLVELGLVDGYADGSMRPAVPVTRGQAAGILRPALDHVTAGEVVCDVGSVEFSDVPDGAVFAGAIGCLADLQVVEGYPDGTFRPGHVLTRGQAASLLVRLADEAGWMLPDGDGSTVFSDVPAGGTHAEAIGRLHAAGVLDGYGDGTFGPQDTVTRGQMASAVRRLLAWLNTHAPSDS